jgi:flagellar motility protein MotE (MotC chaperone)
MNMGTLLRGSILLGLIWAVVWGVTSWSGARKATPEKVSGMIGQADFEDWSVKEMISYSESRREQRIESIDEIAGTLNRLDLRQRKQLDEQGEVIEMFFRFSKEEKLRFVDLIFNENMERLMKSFDEMPSEERQKMVERSVQDMTDGKGAEALARLKEEDPEILNVVISKGFSSYYQGASADIKMSLLPFMDAVGEIVQGFAKPKVGL